MRGLWELQRCPWGPLQSVVLVGPGELTMSSLTAVKVPASDLPHQQRTRIFGCYRSPNSSSCGGFGKGHLSPLVICSIPLCKTILLLLLLLFIPPYFPHNKWSYLVWRPKGSIKSSAGARTLVDIAPLNSSY